MATGLQTQEISPGDQGVATMRSDHPERNPKTQPWLKLVEIKGTGREAREGQPAVSKDEHGFAAGEMFLVGHGGKPFKSCWTRVEWDKYQEAHHLFARYALSQYTRHCTSILSRGSPSLSAVGSGKATCGTPSCVLACSLILDKMLFHYIPDPWPILESYWRKMVISGVFCSLR